MDKILSESQLSEYYVQPVEKKRALDRLSELENEGYDIDEILRISSSYYREKVKKGLCPMSALIYYRIMLEKPLDPIRPEPRRCIGCGQIISSFRIYCSECKDRMKVQKGKDRADHIPYVHHRSKASKYIKDF